jgi:hypothetical protein
MFSECTKPRFTAICIWGCACNSIICSQTLFFWPLVFYPPLYKAQILEVVHATVLFFHNTLASGVLSSTVQSTDVWGCACHSIICPQTLWPRGFYPPLHKAQMFGVVHATVLFVLKHFELWSWICKLLRSPGIDSARLGIDFGLLKRLQIWALGFFSRHWKTKL